MTSTGIKSIKIPVITALAALCVMLLFAVGGVKAEAKTVTIRTPEQLRDLNWKNKGFGPGTYKIGNDMTLGEDEYATCTLTQGKFVIDFNGHTVQNSRKNLGVFSLRGADVTFKDSKVKSNKPSVRSYGAGAIDMTAGKLNIKSGNYIGLSDGTNDPCGLHVGGGSCVVNGGFFYGDYLGADCSGGSLKINNGTFQAGYTFGLMDMGGNIKIAKGNFISGTTTVGYKFALGAFDLNHNPYDFSSWLAKGCAFSTEFMTAYWNSQSQVYEQPSILSTYAVSYNTPTISVTPVSAKPGNTSITSISKGSSALRPRWKKVNKNTTGYQLRYSTSSKFKNAKTLTVKGKKTTSALLSGLKSHKKYYVSVRAYRSFNGGRLYSKWSKAKSKTTG